MKVVYIPPKGESLSKQGRHNQKLTNKLGKTGNATVNLKVLVPESEVVGVTDATGIGGIDALEKEL